MAIPGLKIINIAPTPNQPVGSDSLFVAFNKIKDNFANISAQASPYSTFVGSGNGINVNSNVTTGTVTITNTGVTDIIAGSGITVSGSNGVVTITSNSAANAISNVDITSPNNTITVSNTVANSNVSFTIDLPVTGITPGSYTTVDLTVDDYGRITAIANGTSSGSSNTIVNGTSNVSINTSGGNITHSVNGVPNVMTISTTSVTTSANLVVNSNANISGTANVGNLRVTNDLLLGNTYISVDTLTTTSTSVATLATVPISGVTGVKFFVRSINNVSGNVGIVTVDAISNGTTANYSAYGNVYIGNDNGTLSVAMLASSMLLRVTPSTSNSISWTTQYQVI